MAADTNGLRLLDQMLLGYPELSWMQAEINERQAWMRLAMSHECGWVGEYIGGFPNFGWEVYDSGSGVLALRAVDASGAPILFDKTRGNTARPSVGIDRAGRVLQLFPGSTLLEEDGSDLTVPNDGVWYTLLCEYHLTKLEPGTLNFTAGSTTVTGVGTQFTRYAQGSEPGEPTLLRVDATDTVQGNEGTYTIATITNDTTLTLTAAPSSTETGIDFRVRGRFAAGVPADPDARWNATVKWSLVARTVTRPTTALVAYDVRRSSGTVTVIDRRHANIWRPIDGRTRGWALVPHNYYSNSASGADGPDDVTLTVRPRDIEVVTGAGAARPCLALSMVPCRTGSHLSGLAADVPTGAMIGILWDNGTNRNVLVKHFTVAEVGADPYLDIGNWDDPDNGSAVNVVTAAGIQDMCLLALPSARGNTHLCLYIDTNGDLFGKFSTDNGGSWGSQFTVWAPSSTDTVSRVSAVLTRMGRIVVACAYNTGNRIRYIYSDDYGNNWLTNTNAGFSSTATGVEAVDLSIVEDDRGNLWTVAAVAATNGLRLYRGQAENNPVADTTEAASGWVVGPENDELSRIEAIAMPNGVIGVLHSMTEASGTTNQLNFIQVVRNHPVHHQPLVLAPVSNNTQNGVVVACTVGLMASGYLHVAYANPYTTSGGTVYNLEVRTHLYAPTEIPRIGAFFGGL